MRRWIRPAGEGNQKKKVWDEGEEEEEVWDEGEEEEEVEEEGEEALTGNAGPANISKVWIGVVVARLSNQLKMQPVCTPIATRAKADSCGLG